LNVKNSKFFLVNFEFLSNFTFSRKKYRKTLPTNTLKCAAQFFVFRFPPSISAGFFLLPSQRIFDRLTLYLVQKKQGSPKAPLFQKIDD
jgi:hypothetical protein